MPRHDNTGAVARAFALAVVCAAGGCAVPAAITPGTPEADVIARFGRPAEVYALTAPAGARRLAYPLGRLNQQTWLVDVDGAGRVLRVQEAISAAHFAQIRVGADDTTAIRREFGPPRVIRSYPLSALTAWMYPYLEDGVWYSEMAIYFDSGGTVRRVESGPDPRFVGGRDGKRD